MDPLMDKGDLAVQAAAAAFTDEILIPLEEATEARGGHWSWEDVAPVRAAARERDLAASNIAPEFGGTGLSLMRQMLIQEEIGRATNGMWALVPYPPKPLEKGTPAQVDRWLRPLCEGRIRSSFCITEEHAGSDVRRVRTSAKRRAGGYVLDGEKWFATSGDVAHLLLVHAHVDGDADKPTVFLVDSTKPGVVIRRMPDYMNHYVHGHPVIGFEGVELGDGDVLGEVGQGFELTKDWFVEARLEVAAHCIGMARRATAIANGFAASRVQFDRPIRDFQAIRFMLADMAVAIHAMQAMAYRLAAAIDGGLDRRTAHAQASAAKLFCSEQGFKVVDSAVQIMGGRGYMRDNPVERLFRDIRVERIYEGTSEIQREIIGGMVAKRGLGIYTLWD